MYYFYTLEASVRLVGAWLQIYMQKEFYRKLDYRLPIIVLCIGQTYTYPFYQCSTVQNILTQNYGIG